MAAGALAVSALLASLSRSSIFPCDMGMELSGDSSGTFTSASLGSYSSYKTMYLTGSICPSTGGSYTLYCKGIQSVDITFNGSSDGDTGTLRCWPSATTGTVTKTLIAHMCYPFSLYYNTGCGESPYADLYITPPSGSQAILDSSYTTQCSWSNCLLDYYGPTCSGYCDVYCNGNGYCSNGTSGTGLCVCTSYASDPFCEDTSSNRFASAAQGLYLYTYDTESFIGDSTTTRLYSFPISSITLAYQSISLEGYLYIPQNGYYDFEVVSSVSAQFILNATTYGSLPTANTCNTTIISYTTSTGKMFLSIGLTYFLMKSNVGCPLLDHNFTLNWKFYRYYSNSDSTPWETFPSRYLTNSK